MLMGVLQALKPVLQAAALCLLLLEFQQNMISLCLHTSQVSCPRATVLSRVHFAARQLLTHLQQHSDIQDAKYSLKGDCIVASALLTCW